MAAKILKPTVDSQGRSNYNMGSANGGEDVVVDPNDSGVISMNDEIASKITPGMSNDEKTAVIRGVVANYFASDSDSIEAINNRDKNGDGKLTASEIEGNGFCADSSAHLAYFMNKNGIDAQVVIANTNNKNIDHAYVVSNGQAIESTNESVEPKANGEQEVVNGIATITYIIPENLKVDKTKEDEAKDDKAKEDNSNFNSISEILKIKNLPTEDTYIRQLPMAPISDDIMKAAKDNENSSEEVKTNILSPEDLLALKKLGDTNAPSLDTGNLYQNQQIDFGNLHSGIDKLKEELAKIEGQELKLEDILAEHKEKGNNINPAELSYLQPLSENHKAPDLNQTMLS